MIRSIQLISSVILLSTLLSTPVCTKTIPETELKTLYEESQRIIPGFAVDSFDAFVEIVRFRDDLINDGVTVHQFVLEDGQDCRCIDVYTQGSLVANGISPSELTFEPITPPVEMPPERQDSDLGVLRHLNTPLDGSLDSDGNVRECPKFSFPRIIPKLAQICQFKCLEDFMKQKLSTMDQLDSSSMMSKTTPSDGHAPLPTTRHHATGDQSVQAYGLGADFNLWSPTIEDPTREFSLAQLWATRGYGTGLQSIEGGWQVYRPTYGDERAHLFLYYTTVGHTAHGNNIGCYNLLCTGFVQTDSSVALGMGFSSYSSYGGNQYYFTLQVYRDPSTGNWWVRFNEDRWVGYYPSSLFNDAGMKPNADNVLFGGEVLDDQVPSWTTTDMGSGKLPKEGFRQAAWLSRLHYYNSSYAYVDTNLTPTLIVPETDSYDINIIRSSNPDWRTHIFFGGPGVKGVAPTLQLFYVDHPSTECFSSGDPFDARYRLINNGSAQRDIDLFIALSFGGDFFFWPSWGQVMDKQKMSIPGSGELSNQFLGFLWPGSLGTVEGMVFYGVMTEVNTFDVTGEVAALPFCALGSGDISFQLRWTYGGGGEGPDLDLHVTNPNGHHIFYNAPSSPDGGALDADDQGACGPGDGQGPENIFWSTGSAPVGIYNYSVQWYASCGYSSANYVLEVRDGGDIVDSKQGSISGGSASFTYDY